MNLRLITDKDLITFLVSKDFEIKNIKKDKNRNRSLVYFEKSKSLDEAILQFVNRTEEINIADYQASERRVKTLLCLKKNE